MVQEYITWDWIGFVALSLATLACGLMVVLARRLVHAALWLAGVFLAVAGWFLYFGSEFLAGIQVLVYVGAILTLILFAVMWTAQEEETGEDTPPGEGHT
jgi:NADH:ubiquinone oxidoreductase subunit 6 (subunit J)